MYQKKMYKNIYVRGSGLECQAVTAQERLRGTTLCPRSVVAGRSYPASEVSSSWEETPQVRGQGRVGEATSRPRPGTVTLRSHPEPEARSGSWEEPEARANGWEEQPEERWLRRHRRA